MNNKTQQLKQLFDKWREKQHNEPEESVKKTKIKSNKIPKERFCEDGIINEEIFESEKIKVLFISNEANDKEYLDANDLGTSRIKSFEDYYESGIDNWGGKLRERVCALYKVITNNYKISEQEVALNFAFININKRGGDKDISNGEHIREYLRYYANEIKKEITIINPDIIVWLGCKTYDMNLHIECLGAEKTKGKVYLNINDKQIPILRMWHTSYYRARNKPMEIFENKITGKLAAKMKMELERYDIK